MVDGGRHQQAEQLYRSMERHLELPLLQRQTSSSIVECFRRFDTVGEGKISRAELVKLIDKLAPGNNFEQLIDAVDLGADGFIDYIEFVDWVCGVPDNKKRSIRTHVDIAPHTVSLQERRDHGLQEFSSWHDDPVVQRILGPNGEVDNINVDPSPKVQTETVADSLFHWSEPAQTLIFLDWDDTLFPTSDVFDHWGVPKWPEQWDSFELTEGQVRCLALWQEALSVYLRTACSLSDRCVIVTNARRGWVDSCIARFAPTLQEIFTRSDGPHVVYARETLNRSDFPGSPRGNPVRYPDEELTQDEADEDLQRQLTKAKFTAMRREARKFYAQYSEQTWKNILSIGDARYEHDAAQDLAFRRRSPDRERLRLKALITPACPPIGDLTYRLKLANILWPAYVKFDGDLDLDMNTPERLQAIANALEMPELHGVIRPTPIREEDEAALENDFDEVTIIVQNRIME